MLPQLPMMSICTQFGNPRALTCTMIVQLLLKVVEFTITGLDWCSGLVGSLALQHSAMLVMCCIVCSIIFTIHVLITVAIQLFEYKSLVKVLPTTKETCCWINGLLWFDHTLYHLSVICQVTSIIMYQK